MTTLLTPPLPWLMQQPNEVAYPLVKGTDPGEGMSVLKEPAAPLYDRAAWKSGTVPTFDVEPRRMLFLVY